MFTRNILNMTNKKYAIDEIYYYRVDTICIYKITTRNFKGFYEQKSKDTHTHLSLIHI